MVKIKFVSNTSCHKHATWFTFLYRQTRVRKCRFANVRVSVTHWAWKM